MSDILRYVVWRYPSWRSWALNSWKSFHCQMLLHQPFTIWADNWPLIFKIWHNIEIWSVRIFYILPSFVSRDFELCRYGSCEEATVSPVWG